MIKKLFIITISFQKEFLSSLFWHVQWQFLKWGQKVIILSKNMAQHV